MGGCDRDARLVGIGPGTPTEHDVQHILPWQVDELPMGGGLLVLVDRKNATSVPCQDALLQTSGRVLTVPCPGGKPFQVVWFVRPVADVLDGGPGRLI